MAPNDHFSSHHGPPPGQGPGTGDRFFDRIRSTGIVRPDQKVLAGVCGAVARRMGVDVKPIRVAWVIAMLTPFSALGLLLYLLGWLLIPQTDGRIVAQQILRGQSRHALFVVALVLFIGMPVVASSDGPPVGLFIGLVVTGFVGWLWWSKKGCEGHGAKGVNDRDGQAAAQDDPAGSPAGQLGQATAQPAAGPDLIKRDPAQAGPPEFRPTAYDPQSHRSEPPSESYGPVPAWQGSQPSAQDDSAGSASARIDDDAEEWEDGQPPPYVNPMTGPKDTDDWRASYQSPAPAEPAAAEAAPVPVDPAPVVLKTGRRRPPGARVVLATAGVALVASAVTLLVSRPESFEQGALTVGLVFLVVVGLATLLVGLAGRRSGGLVALAIPALIVTGTSQGPQWEPRQLDDSRGGNYRSAFSEGDWDPPTLEQIRNGVTARTAFGSGTLDLAAATSLAADDTAEVDLKTAFGSLKVLVPEGVTVTVDEREAFGDVHVDPRLTEPAEGDQPQLALDARTSFGSIEIKQR